MMSTRSIPNHFGGLKRNASSLMARRPGSSSLLRMRVTPKDDAPPSSPLLKSKDESADPGAEFQEMIAAAELNTDGFIEKGNVSGGKSRDETEVRATLCRRARLELGAVEAALQPPPSLFHPFSPVFLSSHLFLTSSCRSAPKPSSSSPSSLPLLLPPLTPHQTDETTKTQQVKKWRWEETSDGARASFLLLGLLGLGSLEAFRTNPLADLPYFVGLAVLTIYIGSHRALTSNQRTNVGLKQGFMAPILASISLMFLYLVVKYLPNLDLQTLFNIYFGLIGTISGENYSFYFHFAAFVW